MTTTGWMVTIIILLAAILGGAWYYASRQAPGPAPSEQTNTLTETPGAPTATTSEAGGQAGASSAAMAATVVYSRAGFSPSEVTIKKGGTVTWKNESGGAMWVASAQHPTHTLYGGTSRTEHCGSANEAQAFDQCRGETGEYSFMFDKTGTWAYHDHINSSRFGRVVVVE